MESKTTQQASDSPVSIVPGGGDAPSSSDGDKTVAAPHFHWKFKTIMPSTKKDTNIFPFLNDNNFQDVLLLHLLLLKTPYRAKYGMKMKAWQDFMMELAKQEDPSGRCPLARAKEDGVKKRVEEYLKLPLIWNKTGSRNDDKVDSSDSSSSDIDYDEHPSKDSTIHGCSRGQSDLHTSSKSLLSEI